jgi:hypothetical protein
MKFLGTFKQIFEAHEVKPRLRDIAMFVTLNNTRLYPREQFDENGDIGGASCCSTSISF